MKRSSGADTGEPAQGSAAALRLAACVLEVLAGIRSTAEAAGALGVSLARYYQLEQRALAGLVQGCEPVRRGRGAAGAPESSQLRRDNERLRRECQRQQALVRLARQAAGLTAPPEAAPASPGKKRRRRQESRGQQAAERLRQAATTGVEERSPAAEP